MSETSRRWCSTCEEESSGHPRICTTCGDVLGDPPSLSTDSAANRGGSDEVENPAGTLRRALEAVAAGTVEMDGLQEWTAVPPEALDPTAATSSSSFRAASKAYVKKLARLTIEENSALLQEALVECVAPPSTGAHEEASSESDFAERKDELETTVRSLQAGATAAEFGRKAPYELVGRLVFVTPATGRGGQLDDNTVAKLRARRGGRSVTTGEKPTTFHNFAFMERGDGVTFAAKALMVESAGASAVVIGNSSSNVWPYIMRDSTGESTAGGRSLSIPVVMVSKKDAERIRRLGDEADSGGGLLRCRVRAFASAPSCTICLEPFKVGDVVLRLPLCLHSFHEDCLLQWLERHHSCPYCRREMPTDDEAFERERRRTARTHAGAWGEDDGLESSQWEGMFG